MIRWRYFLSGRVLNQVNNRRSLEGTALKSRPSVAGQGAWASWGYLTSSDIIKVRLHRGIPYSTHTEDDSVTL